MHTPDLRRIRRSVDWFEPCGPALIAQAARFAADRDADIAALLPDDQEHMNTLLFRTLVHVVNHAENFALLEAQLATVAARARKVGVRANQLPVMRDCLIEALSGLAGREWTPALERDWRMLLDGVIGAMLVGPATKRQAA